MENEYSICLEYDSEQAGGNSAKGIAKRSMASHGGTIDDVSESYGIVSVSCSLKGKTPEQIIKIGSKILDECERLGIKASCSAVQTFHSAIVHGAAENGDEAFKSFVSDLVRAGSNNHIHNDRHHPEDLIVLFSSKSQRDSSLSAVAEKSSTSFPGAKISSGVENVVVMQSDNYSKKKKAVI